MSHVSDWLRTARRRIETATRLRVVVSAFGILVGGTLLSFVVFMGFRPAVSALLEPSSPALATLAKTKGAQAGFAVFLGVYFAVMRRWGEYVNVQVPSLHGLVWVVVGSVGLDLAADATTLLLPVFGLSIDVLSGTGSGGLDIGLATWPVLWPLVFLGLYLLPALVEEQFYRGVVHERLREGFHPVSGVVLGAAFFTLSHGLYGIGGGPEFLATYLLYLFGQGLVFCLVYERTNNVVTVALVHALSWTSLDFPFFGLL
ncbi:hypothetical protein C455_05422 [Haloferax larsenii JCM 13917]|nr:CPBP family intramembrane glutamic endopeptidase [Haloferax larsenii]ELZ80875.1 hypothetical protein C455_05422 [Haloferax larsenii JCM 13917]